MSWKPPVSNKGANAGVHNAISYATLSLPSFQAYSPALPVGAQHYYKNSFNAVSTIFKADGFRGLVRGMDAAILRTSMGSSVQSLFTHILSLLLNFVSKHRFNYLVTISQKTSLSSMEFYQPTVLGRSC